MNTQQAMRLVKQFEAGTYPAKDWSHHSHIVMGLWYLFHWPEATARRFIKEGVKNYNLSQGGTNSDTEGYHESMTEFYIKVLQRFLRSQTADDFDIALAAVRDQPFMQSSFIFDYYSKERLMSTVARRSWVEPDFKPISVP